MTVYLGLAILMAFTAYSLLNKAIDRTVLTLPMLFSGTGWLLSAPLHTYVEPASIEGSKLLLGEITLILVLFSDASRVRFNRLSLSWTIPARMLVIGMPLTVALGTTIVYWVNPTTGLAMALLTAAVLTPTDAALGQSVVSSPDVPERLAQTINVESGLNDGLVLPFVLFGAILASTAVGDSSQTGGLAFEAIREIVLGPVAGIAVGWFLAKLLDKVQERDLNNEAGSGVVFLCAAFMSYLLSSSIGGNGFIAAFVGGMVFGNTYRHNIRFITEFMDGAGQLLTMAAFLLFGAFLLPLGLAFAQPITVVLALLFLTVVRMLPIFVSLTGSGLNTCEKLFLGWFGPRGIASILFTMIIIDDFDFPNEADLLACVSLTVGLSILLHGLSAMFLASRITGWTAKPDS
jgi:NhaP-type Na+/H+ or K+/H+ antiporter